MHTFFIWLEAASDVVKSYAFLRPLGLNNLQSEGRSTIEISIG